MRKLGLQRDGLLISGKFLRTLQNFWKHSRGFWKLSENLGHFWQLVESFWRFSAPLQPYIKLCLFKPDGVVLKYVGRGCGHIYHCSANFCRKTSYFNKNPHNQEFRMRATYFPMQIRVQVACKTCKFTALTHQTLPPQSSYPQMMDDVITPSAPKKHLRFRRLAQ